MVVGPPPCCSWHAIWLSCLKGGKRSELPGWLLLPARPNVLILSFCNPLVEVLCSKLTELHQPRSDPMLGSLTRCSMNPLCYSFVPASQRKRVFFLFLSPYKEENTASPMGHTLQALLPPSIFFSSFPLPLQPSLL